MENRWGNRYAIRSLAQTLPLGQLHEAEDLSLNRRVLLYELDRRRETADSQAALLRAAAFTHDSFMHILDIGMDSFASYAVFKACQGSPLVQQLRRHTFTAEQLLQRVYALGQAMLEAAEEGFYGFSVLADNLWDGYGSRFLPIHYWESSEEHAKGALGLCGLLCQLLLKEESLSAGTEAAEHRLRLALRELPADRAEALLALMDRVYREKPALTAFLSQLRTIIFVDAINTIRDPIPAVLPEPKPVVRAVAAAAEPDKKRRTEEAAAFRAGAADAGADVEADAADDEPLPADRRKIWRRIALVAGGAGLFVIVFIGCLTLIFQIGNRPDRVAKQANDAQPAAAAETAKPNGGTAPGGSGSSAQNGSAAPKDDTANQAAGLGGPTTIPNLVGLARADAEKQALAAGLHYSFAIEPNDGKQGTVFKQEPAAGAAAVRGDSVKFWVAKAGGGQ